MNPTSVNDFDRKLRKFLSTAIKPRPTSSQQNNARAQLKDLDPDAQRFGFSSLVQELGNFFLTRGRLRELGQPETFPTQQFIELGRGGLSRTLEFGITQSPESFAELPVEVLLREISSPKLLGKVASKNKRLLGEAVGVLQRQPGVAVDLPGLSWIMSKARIEQLFPLLPAIFAEKGGSLDPKRSSLLRSQFLARDKAGKGVVQILALISKGELPKEPVIESLTGSPEAAVVFLRLLPRLLGKSLDGPALGVLEGWLASLPEIALRKRSLVSGALAILCGQLIKKPKRRPAEEMALSTVIRLIRQLSLQIGADVDGYWGLFPLKESPSGSGGTPAIHPDGARLLVESLEKLEDGRYEPGGVFKALAQNLGLSQIEEPGTIVTYEPKKHEDTVGGLLKDQRAVVVRAGWSYKELTLLKSKVRPETKNA